MRLACAIALVVLAGCAEETPRSQLREGQPVAAPFVEIVCTEDGGTRLWTPVVEVQSDGVHLDIDNRAGEPTSFFGLGNLDAEEGRTKVVITEPPGKQRIACYPYSQHESDAKPVKYDLELVDPKGHWISTELECEPGSMGQSTQSDYFQPLGDGLSKDPVQLVHHGVKGLEADDVVELAGYPEAETPTVRVVRAERVIATFGFIKADDGGLAIERSELCASDGLRE
jgi:hypothetical protein